MRKLLVYAVGSNLLIAQEVAAVCRSLLGELIEVHIATPADMGTVKKEALYVCAMMQAEELRHIVPEEQLCVFDLRPTAIFFLSVARAAKGERVAVLHNRVPYAQFLIEECQRLGLDGPDFVPLGFEEQTEEEVRAELAKARWLIGIGPFLEGDVVLGRYRDVLPGDVQVVAARRTASVRTACRFLVAGLELILERLQLERFRYASEHNEVRLRELAATVRCVAECVQKGAVQAVVNQLETALPPAWELPAIELPPPGTDFAELLVEVDEALWTLHYLKGKVEVMRAGKRVKD